MPVYVLTYEYSEGREGTNICAVTAQLQKAMYWYAANDSTNVYEIVLDDIKVPKWVEGVRGWRQLERDKYEAEKDAK